MNNLDIKINKHGVIVLPADAYLLHTYLNEKAVGEKNAIKAKEISDQFGWTPRKVRELRAIVNSPSSPFFHKILAGNKGYFVPTTDEADDAYELYEQRLTSQALSLLEQVSALRKNHKRNGQTRLAITTYTQDIVKIAHELGENQNAI